MKIPGLQGFQLRALFLPVGVAMASAAVLAWYAFLWIPVQEQYLNERNFRLLGTLSAQMQVKVDNFGLSLQNALDSFDLEGFDPKKRAEFLDYVKVFSRELEVLELTPDQTFSGLTGSVEREVLEGAGSSPRVKLQRDGGRTYLYLGFRPRVRGSAYTVVARADIGRAVDTYLQTGAEFDALVLVGRDGSAIAQQSLLGLNVVDVDLQAVSTSPPTSGAAARAAGPEALSPFDRSRIVTIRDATYRLYAQPIRLSMTSVGKEGLAEEWQLLGLVQTRKLRASSAAFSYTYLLLFSAALVCVFISIPLLKLHVLKPRERLRRGDGVLVAASMFGVTAGLAIALMHAHYFGYDFSRFTDAQLEQVADGLQSSFVKEVAAISDQMYALEETAWRKGVLHGEARPQSPDRPPSIRLVGGATVCEPSNACGSVSTYVDDGGFALVYPYFDLVIWNDMNGWQRVKWTGAATLTPFLNISEQEVPYYPALQRAVRVQDAPQAGVQAFPSPNTGRQVSVFWRARRGKKIFSGAHDVQGQSMAIYGPPVSFDQPVLPRGVQFAVVDARGQVVFHSERSRNLQENFLQESEDDSELRATILSGQDRALSVSYLARPHRLHVRPLGLTEFGDPAWTLIVFQETRFPDTIGLETLGISVVLFLIFGLLLAAGWALHYSLFPRGATKWFWPDREKGPKYVAVALMNGALFLLFLAGVSRLASMTLLVVTGCLVLASLGATYAIVSRLDWPRVVPLDSANRMVAESAYWRHAFLWARLSLLLVVVAAPAIACFHVAYDFEMRLFTRSGQLQFERDSQDRDDRIERRLEVLRLKHSDPAAWLKQQGAPDLSGVRLDEVFPALEGAPLAELGTRLDRFLASLHRPYNDVAIDPESAFRNGLSSSSRPAPTVRVARATFWYVPVTIVLAIVLYLLLRWIEPLYSVGLSHRPRRIIYDRAQTSANVLFVGPPGSGKSATLRESPGVHVVDVRTLIPRSGVENWAATFDYHTVRQSGTGPIGIDHFEYCLDNPHVREQTLLFLEQLVYRDNRTVWVFASREPSTQLREALADETTAEDQERHVKTHHAAALKRWARVFQSFKREIVGVGREGIPKEEIARLLEQMEELGIPASSAVHEMVVAECLVAPQLTEIGREVISRCRRHTSFNVEDVRREIGAAAEPYYRSVLVTCSVDERLALRHIADEGMVNPHNHVVVEQLMRIGLVQRDRSFRLMNETFRRFIMHAVPKSQVSVWEREGVSVPWGNIGTTLATVGCGLIGLLVLTQEQLLGAWIGYAPALVPALPTLLRMFAGVRSDSKVGMNA